MRPIADLQLDWQPGCGHPVDQRLELPEARLRLQVLAAGQRRRLRWSAGPAAD